jgi:hypothetical protein
MSVGPIYIYGVRADDTYVFLFTWTLTPEMGIQRARREAKLFGREKEFVDYVAEESRRS